MCSVPLYLHLIDYNTTFSPFSKAFCHCISVFGGTYNKKNIVNLVYPEFRLILNGSDLIKSGYRRFQCTCLKKVYALQLHSY